MHKEEIRSLTGLRFLIALYVFVFHIHIRWPIFDNFVLVEIANQGAIGMTFFFVLILSSIFAYKIIEEPIRKRINQKS